MWGLYGIKINIVFCMSGAGFPRARASHRQVRAGGSVDMSAGRVKEWPRYQSHQQLSYPPGAAGNLMVSEQNRFALKGWKDEWLFPLFSHVRRDLQQQRDAIAARDAPQLEGLIVVPGVPKLLMPLASLGSLAAHPRLFPHERERERERARGREWEREQLGYIEFNPRTFIFWKSRLSFASEKNNLRVRRLKPLETGWLLTHETGNDQTRT